jgi:hypothetical protein
MFEPDPADETAVEQKIRVLLSREDVSMGAVVESDREDVGRVDERGGQWDVKAEILSIDASQTTAIKPDVADSIEPTRNQVPGPVGFEGWELDFSSVGSESLIALTVELVGVVEVPAVGEIDRLAGPTATPKPTPPDLPADKLPPRAEVIACPKRKLDHC